MGFSHLYALCFLHSSLPLYSFIILIHSFYASSRCLSPPHCLSFLPPSSSSLPLSPPECFGELLSTDGCVSPVPVSASLCLCFSLSRRRGIFFLIKAPAPELTQRTTKSHHHHHPWEPINNSAGCPMRHRAWRYFCSALYSRRALLHGKCS